MDLRIGEFKKRDYKQAIQSAITGMNLSRYLEEGFLLDCYGKYFLYMEMNRATQVIAAYEGDRLVGILLADMKGEKKRYRSFPKSVYVKLFDVLQHLAAGRPVGAYEDANKAMFKKYCEGNDPDGEIIFLAADPTIHGKGIGSFLLDELERREKGKQIYLYTDSGCTYQFYEHRGFDCAGEKKIMMDFRDHGVGIRCLLYSKTIK